MEINRLSNQNENQKMSPKVNKRVVGIVMICLSIALFVVSTFEFLYGVKTFLLGTFGVMLYAVLLFTLLFGIAFAGNKKFIYSPKYILYLFLSFFFFVCILQIIFTGFKGQNLNYGEYLRACYHSMYTPGGVVIGVFTFPLMSLLHDIAGIVIYGIALIISIYFILNYLEDYKATKLQEKRPDYKTFHFDSQEVDYYKGEQCNVEEENNAEDVKEDIEEKTHTDEDIFIKDEDAIRQDRAKELLGLKKLEDNEEDEEETGSLYDETPLSQKLTHSWQNRAVENKPQKFIYQEEKNIKKDNPMFKENIEYLTTIHDLNNQNDNPIINAEDYEDYKEKMRQFNLRQNNIVVREQKPTPNNKVETNFVNQFEIEPQKNNYQSNNTKFNADDDEDEGKLFDSFDEEIDDISPIINLDDDFIKPQEYEKKFSPLNPNNFVSTEPEDNHFEHSFDKNNPYDIEQEKRQPIIEQNNEILSQKFMEGDYKSAINDSVGDSLGKNFGVGKSFNLNIINGGSNSNQKETVPNFDYPNSYNRPPVDLLKTYINDNDNDNNQEENIALLENVLNEFKIPAKVEAVRRGAAVTRYELHMPVGIPVRKIHAHSSDIALALAAKSDIRIETPIKGKSAVGVEVPNDKIDTIGLKDIISSPRFTDSKAPLTFALGKDVDGNVYCCNLDKMPHLLVAGSTGSGKSVCLNALILSLMFRTSPEDLRFILVDPKRVEFGIYNDLPHLLMPKVITEPKKAINAFDWLIDEMERRFGIFQECFVKNLAEYNSQPEVLSKKMPKLPYIVLIVDELADLVVTTNKKELEERIIRLTQKARAAGIHLILATQRPSVDIITGSIKINLPSRIAFAVTNFVDSKTILDQGGAEKLLGKGDMLYKSRDGEPVRVQGAFVDTPEVKAVVDYIRENNACYYDENIEKIINSDNSSNSEGGGYSGGANNMPSVDSLMPDALKLVIENGQASISLLQRRFAIGYQRAAKIIDQMEMAGFISSSDGSKPRSVYITMQDYNKIYGGQ